MHLCHKFPQLQRIILACWWIRYTSCRWIFWPLICKICFIWNLITLKVFVVWLSVNDCCFQVSFLYFVIKLGLIDLYRESIIIYQKQFGYVSEAQRFTFILFLVYLLSEKKNWQHFLVFSYYLSKIVILTLSCELSVNMIVYTNSPWLSECHRSAMECPINDTLFNSLLQYRSLWKKFKFHKVTKWNRPSNEVWRGVLFMAPPNAHLLCI